MMEYIVFNLTLDSRIRLNKKILAHIALNFIYGQEIYMQGSLLAFFIYIFIKLFKSVPK